MLSLSSSAFISYLHPRAATRRAATCSYQGACLMGGPGCTSLKGCSSSSLSSTARAPAYQALPMMTINDNSSRPHRRTRTPYTLLARPMDQRCLKAFLLALPVLLQVALLHFLSGQLSSLLVLFFVIDRSGSCISASPYDDY